MGYERIGKRHRQGRNTPRLKQLVQSTSVQGWKARVLDSGFSVRRDPERTAIIDARGFRDAGSTQNENPRLPEKAEKRSEVTAGGPNVIITLVDDEGERALSCELPEQFGRASPDSLIDLTRRERISGSCLRHRQGRPDPFQ